MMSSTPETDLEYTATAAVGEHPSSAVAAVSDPAEAAAATVAARKPRAARRIPKSDAVLEAAVERARLGLLEVAPEPQVGRHVSATIDGERLVTHRFEAFVPGYAGWQWYATLARVSRSKDVTVCEVGLLPGAAALLAPEWLPWSERVRPEDSQPEDGGAEPATAVAEEAPGAPQEAAGVAGLTDIAEAAELAGAAEIVEVAGAAESSVALDDDDTGADADGTDDPDTADTTDSSDADAEGRPDAG
jgi:hypothetical protein